MPFSTQAAASADLPGLRCFKLLLVVPGLFQVSGPAGDSSLRRPDGLERSTRSSHFFLFTDQRIFLFCLIWGIEMEEIPCVARRLSLTPPLLNNLAAASKAAPGYTLDQPGLPS
jgi:hypothetical protein